MSIYQVRNSTSRITGLASGLDTDEVIKGMLQREQSKIYSTEADKTVFTWKQEAYRDVLSKIKAFNSKYLDVLSKDYILNPSKFSSYEVKYGSTSGAFSVTADSKAVAGTYKMRVNRLASKARQTSSTNLSYGSASKRYEFKKVVNASNDEFTVNGKSFALESKTYQSSSELVAEFNKKFEDNDVDAVARLNDGQIAFDNKIEITDTNKEITVSLDGKDYDVELDTGKFTLEQISSQLNSALASAKASDDTKFSDQGYKVELSSDRLELKLTKEGESDVDNAVKFKSSSTDVVSTSVSIDSTEKNGTGTSVSNFTIASGEVSFENRVIAGVNDEITVVEDGVETTITLDPKVYSGSESVIAGNMKNDINNKLIGAGVTNLSLSVNSDNKFVFKSTSDKPVSLKGNAASDIGVYEGFNLDTRTYNKASDIFTGTQEFEINGKVFKFDFDSDTDAGDVVGAKDKSLDDIFKTIEDETGVVIRYSELAKKFLIETKEHGASQKIDATDNSGNFMNALFGGDISGVTGEDSEVIITDPSGLSNTVHQSSNSFKIDSIQYELKEVTAGEESFTVSSNTDQALDNIKSFIDDYNALITDLNSKVDERKSYSYKPLNAEQKKEMKEDEIKEWNKNAKKGLISNDRVISNMLTKMRSAFYDKVEGATGTLKEMGISTSSDYTKKGKIEIDEAKLKAALAENPDQVMDLLIGKSESEPVYSRTAKSDERSVRYNESGIFNRLNDIIQDNTSTYRDRFGKKGSLVEIAGIEGDKSFKDNILSDRIEEKEKLIKELTEKMYTKQEAYYKKFARLEKMMNQYNSQQSYFASQMGG